MQAGGFLCDPGSLTLVHGDPRCENFFLADDGVKLIDFQLMKSAPAAFDVAYMMYTNMGAAAAAEHELELMAGYHRTLLGQLSPEQAAGLTFTRFASEYQAAVLYFVYQMFIAGDLEESIKKNPPLWAHMLGNLDAAFARWDVPAFFEGSMRRCEEDGTLRATDDAERLALLPARVREYIEAKSL